MNRQRLAWQAAELLTAFNVSLLLDTETGLDIDVRLALRRNHYELLQVEGQNRVSINKQIELNHKSGDNHSWRCPISSKERE